MPKKSTTVIAAAAATVAAKPVKVADAFAAAALGRQLHALYAFRIPIRKLHKKRSATGLGTDYTVKLEIFEDYLNCEGGIYEQLEADEEECAIWTRRERRQMQKIIKHSNVREGRIAFRDWGVFSKGEQFASQEELKWRTAHDDCCSGFHFRKSPRMGGKHEPLTIVKMDDGFAYIVFQVEERERESKGKWSAVRRSATVAAGADAEAEAADAEAADAEAADVEAAEAAEAADPDADTLAALRLELAAVKAENAALKAELAYLKHKKSN